MVQYPCKQEIPLSLLESTLSFHFKKHLARRGAFSAAGSQTESSRFSKAAAFCFSGDRAKRLAEIALNVQLIN